jgi:hypothetical protein
MLCELDIQIEELENRVWWDLRYRVVLSNYIAGSLQAREAPFSDALSSCAPVIRPEVDG